MLQLESRSGTIREIRRFAAKISIAQRRPSDEHRAGGDFVEITRQQDGITLFVVGDVSAKQYTGLRHATFLLASYRRAADSLFAPHTIIARMNVDYVRYLRRVGELSTFASVFVAAFSDSGWITYASAGAPPALLMCGSREEELWPTGIVLGVDDEERYAERLIPFGAGHTLVAFTDGVFECASRGFPNRMLGSQVISHVVRIRVAASLPVSAGNVLDYAAARCDNGFVDDATVLVCTAENA